MGRLKPLNWVVVAFAAFLFLFVIVPIGSLFLTGVTGKTIPVLEYASQFKFKNIVQETAENFTLNYLKELAQINRYRKAAQNSLWIAFLVATVSCLLALPISLALARRIFFVPKLFETLVLLPLVTPAFLYAFAIILMAKGSFFNPFSVGGLILTQITAFVPLAVIIQTPSFSLYSANWNVIGRSLGAQSFFSVLRVWLPLNAPVLLSSWILVALRSLGDFVTPMLLASTHLRLLVLEAYRDLAGSNWWPGACALSVELLLITLVLLIVEKTLAKSQRSIEQMPASGQMLAEKSVPSPWLRYSASLYGVLVLIVPLFAVGVVVTQSFGTGHWSLDSYRAVFKDSYQPIINSLILGLVVVVFAMITSFAVVQTFSRFKLLRRFITLACTFAFAVPSTIYAIALISVFNRPPIFIHFTPMLLVIAIFATRATYALQILSRSKEKLGFLWEEAASVFGATPLFAFRWASFPYLKAAFTGGALLVFISALQDVAIGVLIAPPRFYPLSLVVVRNLADGLFVEASVLGVILMAILLVVSSFSFKNLILSREAEL